MGMYTMLLLLIPRPTECFFGVNLIFFTFFPVKCLRGKFKVKMEPPHIIWDGSPRGIITNDIFHTMNYYCVLYHCCSFPCEKYLRSSAVRCVSSRQQFCAVGTYRHASLACRGCWGGPCSSGGKFTRVSPTFRRACAYLRATGNVGGTIVLCLLVAVYDE